MCLRRGHQVQLPQNRHLCSPHSSPETLARDICLNLLLALDPTPNAVSYMAWPWQQPALPQVPCRNGKAAEFLPLLAHSSRKQETLHVAILRFRFGPKTHPKNHSFWGTPGGGAAVLVPALDLPSRPRWARVRKPKETSHGKYRHLQENRQ